MMDEQTYVRKYEHMLMAKQHSLTVKLVEAKGLSFRPINKELEEVEADIKALNDFYMGKASMPRKLIDYITEHRYRQPRVHHDHLTVIGLPSEKLLGRWSSEELYKDLERVTGIQRKPKRKEIESIPYEPPVRKAYCPKPIDWTYPVWLQKAKGELL